MTDAPVDTQVIANLVVRDGAGRVLFVRYDPENEKWWLPGEDVAPFTHPDDTAAKVLADLPGLDAGPPRLDHVESFRGRRGWHLVFHYDVAASGTPAGGPPAQWFATDDLPRTMHGGWEKQVVAKVTGAG
jgi:ADP-ribose pyrophosphatase YjhB (NUDIX family)